MKISDKLIKDHYRKLCLMIARDALHTFAKEFLYELRYRPMEDDKKSFLLNTFKTEFVKLLNDKYHYNKLAEIKIDDKVLNQSVAKIIVDDSRYNYIFRCNIIFKINKYNTSIELTKIKFIKRKVYEN